MAQFRKRKIRTYMVPNSIYFKYKRCVPNMSRDLESYMRRRVKRR